MSFKYKEEAQKVAKKLNISSISWIGEGEYGAAYETQDGRVLKSHQILMNLFIHQNLQVRKMKT